MPRPSRLGPSAVETVPVLVAIRLTIVFACSAGRPAGLNLTNDEELHSLLADIEAWKNNLPSDLQFRGPETPRSAGTSSRPLSQSAPQAARSLPHLLRAAY